MTRSVAWAESIVHLFDGHYTSYLLRGDDLNEAEQWLTLSAEKEPKPAFVQTEFIMDSRKAATKRQRIIIGVSLVGLLIALVLAGFAYIQSELAKQNEQTALQERDEAQRQRKLAEERYRQARGRQLAIMADRTRAERPDQLRLSVLLAAEAMRNLPSFETDQALRAGLGLLPRMKWNALLPSQDAFGLGFNPEGTRIVTVDGVWVAATGRREFEFQHEGRSKAFALSADGSRVTRGGGAGIVGVWDVKTGEKLMESVTKTGPQP